MIILVTGGTGLVGSRIVRDLLLEYETVIAHDLYPDSDVIESLLSAEQRTGLTIVQGDILDFDGLVALCEANQVDHIVHTASVLGSAHDRAAMVDTNTGGMIRILELARLLDIKKVVYSSTNALFAANDAAVIPNDGPFRPDGLYGATKAFNEYAAEIYYRNDGVDVTGIRIGGNVFGALSKRVVYALGDARTNFAQSRSIAIEALYKPAIGEPGYVPYDDAAVWLYADDVARAHVLACRLKRLPGMAGSYNIAGTVVPFPELVAFVKKLLPKAEITMEHRSLGWRNWNVDASLAEKELGYRPIWDFWEAVVATINEIRRGAGLPAVSLLPHAAG